MNVNSSDPIKGRQLVWDMYSKCKDKNTSYKKILYLFKCSMEFIPKTVFDRISHKNLFHTEIHQESLREYVSIIERLSKELVIAHRISLPPDTWGAFSSMKFEDDIKAYFLAKSNIGPGLKYKTSEDYISDSNELFNGPNYKEESKKVLLTLTKLSEGKFVNLESKIKKLKNKLNKEREKLEEIKNEFINKFLPLVEVEIIAVKSKENPIKYYKADNKDWTSNIEYCLYKLKNDKFEDLTTSDICFSDMKKVIIPQNSNLSKIKEIIGKLKEKQTIQNEITRLKKKIKRVSGKDVNIDKPRLKKKIKNVSGKDNKPKPSRNPLIRFFSKIGKVFTFVFKKIGNFFSSIWKAPKK